MKHLKKFESFSLRENVEIKGDYDIEPFTKLKEDLLKINWIKDGCVDLDHFELFNRDNSEDLEDGVRWGEIRHDSVITYIKDFLSDKLTDKFEVETTGYPNSDKITIYIREIDGGGQIEFDIEDNIDYSIKED